MLLNMKNEQDISQMMKYGKVKGTILLNKYLPKLNPFSNVYVVDSHEEWDKIKDSIPDRIFFRADTKIGDKPVYISGASDDKEEIPEFIDKIKAQNEEGVLDLFESKNEPSPRYTLNGGFNVSFSLNDAIWIEFVGKGFDGRELTKGIACHASYKIPWNQVLFCDQASKLKSYQVHIATQSEYEASVKERIAFFEEIHIPEEVVRPYIPSQFDGIDNFLIDILLEQMIFPLYCQSEELKKDHLEQFGIAGNIDGTTLVSFEIYRPERLIKK